MIGQAQAFFPPFASGLLWAKPPGTIRSLLISNQLSRAKLTRRREGLMPFESVPQLIVLSQELAGNVNSNVREPGDVQALAGLHVQRSRCFNIVEVWINVGR
jgi:hypothetical protein